MTVESNGAGGAGSCAVGGSGGGVRRKRGMDTPCHHPTSEGQPPQTQRRLNDHVITQQGERADRSGTFDAEGGPSRTRETTPASKTGGALCSASTPGVTTTVSASAIGSTTKPSQTHSHTSLTLSSSLPPADPKRPIIPEHLLGVLIAPFLPTRQSFNNFSRTHGDIYRACKNVPAPWPKRTFKAHAMVHAVAFDPTEGEVLACAARESVYLWNRRTGHKRTLTTCARWPHTILTCLTISPDGKYLVAGHRTSSMYAWHNDDDSHDDDSQSRSDFEYDSDDPTQEDQDRRGPSISIWCLDRLLRHNGDRFQGDDHEYCRKLYGHSSGGVLTVAFSPNSQIMASGGVDQTIRLWQQADDFQLRAVLRGHSNWIYCVQFSPDSTMLASVGEDDTTVRLWDMKSIHSSNRRNGVRIEDDGEDIDTPVRSIALKGHTECVHCVSFSPDGSFLASGSDDESIRLWDMTCPETPHCYRVLRGFGSAVWTLACASPDLIVCGGLTRGLYILHAATGACLAKLHGHDERQAITAIALSPSGRTIASGSLDRSVRTWNVAHELMKWRGGDDDGNTINRRGSGAGE